MDFNVENEDGALRSNSMSMAIQQQVGAELGRYVYMLVDPRCGLPFYVGKGEGSRFADHGLEAEFPQDADAPQDQSRKIECIKQIREAGLEPKIWILRYGMNSVNEYTAVEAAAIDLLRSFPFAISQEALNFPDSYQKQLTNARREAARGHGISLLDDLIRDKAAPELQVRIPLVLIKLKDWQECPEDIPGEEIRDGIPVSKTRDGYGYKKEWLTSAVRQCSFDAMSKSICGWWKIDINRIKKNDIQYVVAVHKGITRGLFKIIPDSWENKTEGQKTLRGFECQPIKPGDVMLKNGGDLYEMTVGEYGRRVPGKASGNPILYWPRE